MPDKIVRQMVVRRLSDHGVRSRSLGRVVSGSENFVNGLVVYSFRYASCASASPLSLSLDLIRVLHVTESCIGLSRGERHVGQHGTEAWAEA